MSALLGKEVAMYTIEVSIKAKGESSDFECNASVQYLHVKSVEQVNAVQKAVADALFGLGAQSK